MSIGTLPTADHETSCNFFPISIQLGPFAPMTQDQFFDFCQLNADKRFERTAQGELIIIPPSGGDAGFQDAEVCRQLGNWAKAVGKGKVSGPKRGIHIAQRRESRLGGGLGFAGTVGHDHAGAKEEIPAGLSLFLD